MHRRWRDARAYMVPAVVAYVVAVSLFLIWRGISVSPDYLVIILLLGAVVLGRWKTFVVDLLPFLALFLGYEVLRGVATTLGLEVHYAGPIAIDSLAGHVQLPVTWLQHHLYHAGSVSALDVGATVVYFMHFAYPLTLGFFFWTRDRSVFRRYAAAMLLMSYTAFLFFILVPVAPPWLAAQAGYLPHVEKIIDHTLPSATSWFYQQLNPNPVAAMPSLHAAFPVLGLLYGLRHIGRRAWVLGIWCLAVFFSIVYLGEHYVADAVGGILLAGAAFSVTEWVYARLGQPREAEPGLASVELVD